MLSFPYMLPVITFLSLIVLLSVMSMAVLSRKCLSVITDHLKELALSVLGAGFLVYFYGYWEFYDERLNFVALTLRSFLSSLGMFALQSDLQYFAQPMVKQNPVFLGVFALVHFLAAFVSAVFIISLVGVKLVSWLKMIQAPGQNLYVFWGLNDSSVTLAEDICHDKLAKDGGMMIFVGAHQDAETGYQQFSISSLIKGKSQRKDRIRRIEEMDAIITYCADLVLTESSDTSCNIFKSAGLKSLSSLIGKSKDKEVRFFFLSDDQARNLELTSLLLNAIEKKDEALHGCQHLDIYCHARKNKENSVLEKQAYVKSDETLPNVHLIDSSNLSIQYLKRNVDYQPVSLVNPVTETASVDSPFTALVIGFGETGRDAVRFLYEFGAFPDSKGQKSPFKCYAIDRQMDELAGGFYNNAPALRGNPEIELLQMTIQSEPFWAWVGDKIHELNYVVISCGNDETGIQLAIDLLEIAYRANKHMDNFKIFVRSYSRENEGRMDEIAGFYNLKTSDSLVVFGKQEQLYTCENIIDEEALEHAREFYAGYASKNTNAPTWDERHIICDKEKVDGKVLYKRKDRDRVTLENINAVIRKECQDIANYRHIDTKLRLAGLSRQSTKEDFDKLTDSQKKSLAICEHLRWNASHEMLGYVYGESASDLHKTHNCLKAWQNLTAEYQSYDYKVMDGTIDIILNSHERK